MYAVPEEGAGSLGCSSSCTPTQHLARLTLTTSYLAEPALVLVSARNADPAVRLRMEICPEAISALCVLLEACARVFLGAISRYDLRHGTLSAPGVFSVAPAVDQLLHLGRRIREHRLLCIRWRSSCAPKAVLCGAYSTGMVGMVW